MTLERDGRNQHLLQDDCTYEVHLCFPHAVQLFQRIMLNNDPSESKKMIAQGLEVIKFLYVLMTCYHSLLESFFEKRKQTKVGCNNMVHTVLENASLHKLTQQISHHGFPSNDLYDWE